jgi:hypothetical protein
MIKTTQLLNVNNMNKPMYVQPKLAQLRLKVTRVGGVTSPSSSSTTNKYDTAYTEAFDKLTADEQAKVEEYLGYKTMYTSYPCSKGDISDWQNFIKYCVISGNYASLYAFSLAWSTQVSNQVSTYTPDQQTRQTALTTYNSYVDNAATTTGVAAACKKVNEANWTENLQYNNLV